MKNILVTPRLLLNESYHEIREALDVNWCPFLKCADILPILFPTKSNVFDYLALPNINGILLTGGNDVLSVNNNELSKLRDTFEEKILSAAIIKRIPVLGICRGLHLICQHFKIPLSEINNHIATKHKVLIDSKSSRFFRNYPEIHICNSYHKYTVTETGAEFLNIGSTEDGAIEAIEHKELPIAAIMWHPEREEDYSENDINFLKGFFA